jgi:hypothetical protein
MRPVTQFGSLPASLVLPGWSPCCLNFILAAVLLCGLSPVLGSDASNLSSGPFAFDRTVSRQVLENYLSRSITMEGLLNGRGDLADNIRMLKEAGAKFIGRSLCLWGGEGRAGRLR